MARGKKRKGLRLLLILLLIAGAAGAYLLFGPNSYKDRYLYIRTGSNYATVIKQLEDGGFVKEINSFKLLAERAGYPAKVKPGKYKIAAGMSNYNIVRMLRNGSQEPVKLVINKLRTKEDFYRFVATQLEADSNQLKALFADSAYLAEYGLDTNTALCAIMPDTYEFYWNTTADKVFRKIAKKYTRFWNEDRKRLARLKGLSPAGVITMASIVEEETNKLADKPLVASVYLNRIDKNMPLQADPTVKFAVGDFAIRRVTGVHLAVVSPYNTYKNKGLPPGPICTPSESSINAVLNAPATDYIYFCATPALDGSSAFTASYDQHLKNAKAYQQALNERGIH
ncbi:MAG: endolytic transglycosylase MltG [Flavipsychrobacter sp.]|nr:endolytic transglycosylase MltG [Flavipsychrobacter sp.]